MLHGDVGSGKTVVAVCAMLLAVAHGGQTALMGAHRNFGATTCQKPLTGCWREVVCESALRTGSQTANERKAQNLKLESGEIDIVVGTTALLNASSKFKNLTLVVIDEQHKFGVKQRAQLRGETDPHYLVMTATPIPRTISMTLFGDLDNSTLSRPDSVGGTVHTYLGEAPQTEKWWEFFRKKLLEGTPRASSSHPWLEVMMTMRLIGAERMFESLANGPLEAFRIDVLHGRQSADEKDATLQGFASGQTQVLVATGVVEVGIDVPNATVMTILSAERFGLSQLHQLRGRIGRGIHPGYVCVFATQGNANENERLAALEASNDGF